MARKRNDFRPDSDGTGLLSKLYLTRKQRQAFLKWLLYGLSCLVLLILQDVLLTRFPLFGAVADPVACAIVLICLLQGAESGGLFALVASALYVFSGSAPGPYTIVFLTVYSVLAAIFRQAYLRKGVISLCLCAFLAMMAYEMSLFGIGLFLKFTVSRWFPSFLLSGVYSVAVLPLLYPIMRSIGNIGGEIWKD